MQLSRSAQLYFIGVVSLGAGVAAYCLWRDPVGGDATFWLLFLAFVILTALSNHYGLQFAHGQTIHVDTIPLFASILYFSPAAAVLIGGLACIVGQVNKLKRPARLVFDLGQTLACVGISAMLLKALIAATPWRPSGWPAWIGVAAGAAALYLLNTLLVAGIASLSRRIGFLTVYRTAFEPMSLIAHLVMLGFGLLTALVIADYPWGVVLIALPLIAVFITLDRTVQMEARQEQLAEQNTELAARLAAQADQLRSEIVMYRQAEQEIRQRNAELAALNQIGQALSRLAEPSEILHSIYTAIGQVLDNNNLYIALYDQASQHVSFPVFTIDGESIPFPSRPFGTGLTEYVIRTRAPLLIPSNVGEETLAELGITMIGLPSESYLAVPMVVGEKVIGVIAVQDYHHTNVYSSAHIELLSTFAAQAAIALENARLYQAEQEQRELAETLRQVGATLVTTLSVDSVLDRLLEQVSRVVPNDAATVVLIEGHLARVARWRGYERFDAETSIATFATPVARVPHMRKMIETGEPVAIPDTHAAPDWLQHRGTRWVRSYVAAPIRARGEVIGFLDIASATPDSFGPAHAGRLRAFADQATIALENARLFSLLNQEKEQLELLYRLGRQLAESLDVRQVAQWALDGVCAIVGALRGVLWVRDPASAEDQDRLQLVAVSGYDAESVDAVNQRLQVRVGKGLVGWVTARRQSTWVDDVTRDERWLAVSGLDDWVRSALCVPLLSGEELVGGLSIYSDQVAFFHQDSCRLVESIAAPVAVAIANARLYQTEREQFQRLQEWQAQLVQAEKMAALGRLVASIAHEINNPLQAVEGCLSLALEELRGNLRRDKLTRYMDIAEKEIERIANIVRRLREFYRPGSQRLQPTDVRTVLESVLELANNQLQNSHVIVERDLAADALPAIQANPNHLSQVFLHLVLNAVDAMAEQGGTLRVRAALDQMRSRRNDHCVTAVRIEFSDTGKGMPPEALPHVFEPFFTTKRGGAGLGLSISYGIIEAYNGQITVTSEVGVGTTFTVWLPVGEA